MDDSIPKPGDLENNNFDFVEAGSGQADMGFNAAQAKANFEKNIGGPTKEAPGPTRDRATQEHTFGPSITVPRASVAEFRDSQAVHKAWNEAFERVAETGGSQEVLTATYSQTPEDYLRDHGDQLTPEERFMVQMSGGMRRFNTNRPSHQDLEGEVTLEGEEARGYERYHGGKESAAALDRFLESAGEGHWEDVDYGVMRVTSQPDPSLIQAFIHENHSRLRPEALDFLTKSLRMKILENRT